MDNSKLPNVVANSTPIEPSTKVSPTANVTTQRADIVSNTSQSKPNDATILSLPKATRWEKIANDTWVLELAALLASSTCMIAIAAILYSFNQQSVPQIRYGITLNALISILATTAKSTLLYAVSNALSQQKWPWFHQRTRPLDDLQCFEEASRGPLGSVLLLSRPTFRSLASLGALITIISLAFDPFVQQVVTQQRVAVSVLSTSAITKQAFYYTLPSDADSVRVVSDIMNNGIWNEYPHLYDRVPSCPTGNCTWPLFDSVGLCHSCRDAESYTSLIGCDLALKAALEAVKPEEPSATRTCTLSLPGGRSTKIQLQVDATYEQADSPELNLTFTEKMAWSLNSDALNASAYDLYDAAFLGVKKPIYAMAYVQLVLLPQDISVDPSSLHVKQALECIVSFCKNRYNLTVSSGVPSVAIVSTDFGTMFPCPEHYPSYTCWQGNPGPVEWITDDEGNDIDRSKFAFSLVDTPSNYALGLSQRLSDISSRTYSLTQIYDNEVMDNTSDYLFVLETSGLDFVLGNLTAALTRFSLSTVNDTIIGFMEEPGIQVNVRWEWLILPIALTVSSIGFVVLTIAQSKRSGTVLWKSSFSALLYHGLENDKLRTDGSVCDTVSGMDAVAKRQNVRLRVSDKVGTKILG